MLKIYGRNSSINVQKAVWAMGEAGLEWEWLDKDGVFGKVNVPDYVAINPQVRIPTLDDDGLLIRQSNVIVRYVARKYAQELLLPEDERAHVEAERWMEWQASDNGAPMVQVFWGLVRTPPEKRNMDEIRAALAVLHDQFRALDAHLADRVCCGGLLYGRYSARRRRLSLPIHGHRPPYLPSSESMVPSIAGTCELRNLVMVPLA